MGKLNQKIWYNNFFLNWIEIILIPILWRTQIFIEIYKSEDTIEF